MSKRGSAAVWENAKTCQSKEEIDSWLGRTMAGATTVLKRQQCAQSHGEVEKRKAHGDPQILQRRAHMVGPFEQLPCGCLFGGYVVRAEGKDAEENPRWRFSSWHRYKELRGSFYELKKSHVYPGYLCCTCPVGIKDELCKHALLLMETEEMISPLPRPLEPRKKRGRKKKVGRALKRV